MTVDRMAALEAVARAARSILSDAAGDIADETASPAEFVLYEAILALDAASPLTTPTPDQGALERARELLMPFNGQHLVADDISQNSAWNVLRDEIAELATAAASEARAAAIAECLDVVKIQKDDDARKRDAISSYSPDWKDKLEWSRQTCELIEKNIRAVAPPAQSEEK